MAENLNIQVVAFKGNDSSTMAGHCSIAFCVPLLSLWTMEVFAVLSHICSCYSCAAVQLVSETIPSLPQASTSVASQEGACDSHSRGWYPSPCNWRIAAHPLPFLRGCVNFPLNNYFIHLGSWMDFQITAL